MQRRQVIIDRLKAKSAFDKPWEESLAEQMGEIDNEILQLTADLDSVYVGRVWFRRLILILTLVLIGLQRQIGLASKISFFLL